MLKIYYVKKNVFLLVLKDAKLKNILKNSKKKTWKINKTIQVQV